MSIDSMTSDQGPTFSRHVILSVTTLMAILLYLDRLAVGIAAEYIREDLRMTQAESSWFLSAFFLTYALGQVPAGWFSDQFGARRVLSIYILGWSAFTGLLGLAYQAWLLIVCRLMIGVFQAGAYPTAGGLIRVWYPVSERGLASAIVAAGGRVGGCLAPLLTAWLILAFLPQSPSVAMTPDEIVKDGRRSLIEKFKPTSESSPLIRRIESRFDEQTQKAITAATSEQDHADGKLDLIAIQEVCSDLNRQMTLSEFFEDSDVTNVKLSEDASRLVQRRTRGESLSRDDLLRLNRLVIESELSPFIVPLENVTRKQGPGWRPTMIAYGLAGVIVTLIFFIVCRDQPADNPFCNEAERQLIEGDATANSMAEAPPFPWRRMLINLSLWGNSMMQFLTNIGWVFAVTWLPRYLKQVHGASLQGQAWMTMITTAAGILGMCLGGWWTDWATQVGGKKWGRRLPIFATRFSAAAGYGICLALSLGVAPDSTNLWLPWAFIAGLCLMTFSVDMGNPAVWAYAQDVGGKYTGSVLGWANMWGNLGAFAAPPIYNLVLGEQPTIVHWNWMFTLCMAAFLVSGLFALLMDSTQTITVMAPASDDSSKRVNESDQD